MGWCVGGWCRWFTGMSMAPTHPTCRCPPTQVGLLWPDFIDLAWLALREKALDKQRSAYAARGALGQLNQV